MKGWLSPCRVRSCGCFESRRYWRLLSRIYRYLTNVRCPAIELWSSSGPGYVIKLSCRDTYGSPRAFYYSSTLSVLDMIVHISTYHVKATSTYSNVVSWHSINNEWRLIVSEPVSRVIFVAASVWDWERKGDLLSRRRSIGL